MLLKSLKRRVIHGCIYFILYRLIKFPIKGIFVDIQMVLNNFLLSLDDLFASPVYSRLAQVSINIKFILLFLSFEVSGAEAEAHTGVNGSRRITVNIQICLEYQVFDALKSASRLFDFSLTHNVGVLVLIIYIWS